MIMLYNFVFYYAYIIIILVTGTSEEIERKKTLLRKVMKPSGKVAD